ncbi:MAG: serine/threonine protein kinase, partial [Planctomycetaceae bacterium]|nr:serine/threonine protein kinase [Planctomycetaceae bacterium]
MPGISVTEFLALLKKSRLLSETQFARIHTGVQNAKRPGNCEKLAETLVQQNVLTQWQSEQLLKGQSGFVLNQYRLLNPVGRGGMGHVFRGLNAETGQIVAIKVMARKLADNQTLVNRFRREIRASSLLNSPHLVRTFDAGRVGKADFMVMEFVHGDLLDRIASRLPVLPEGIAAEIVRQAANGLQHAHEKHMVHRDLKPANVMIHWDDEGIGTVKVMDMGLVRIMSEESEETKTVTRAGQVMGTPDYMSPEQAWDTAKVDIRGDIYSLGCLLFRLLTGQVPFAGDNPLQVLMARCSRDAPAVRSLNPAISLALEAVVQRMTLRDPDARYQSPQDVAEALAPHCQPLTQVSLREASLASIGAESFASEEKFELKNEPADLEYNRFLREMQSGAEVDLLFSGSSGDVAFSPADQTRPEESTAPALRNVEPRAARVRKRPPVRRGHRLAIWLVSGTAALLIGVLMLLAALRSDAPMPSSNGVNSGQTGPEKLPAAVIQEAADLQVVAGAEFIHEPRIVWEAGSPPA